MGRGSRADLRRRWTECGEGPPDVGASGARSRSLAPGRRLSCPGTPPGRYIARPPVKSLTPLPIATLVPTSPNA